jgi:serine/threonine protein kinase
MANLQRENDILRAREIIRKAMARAHNIEGTNTDIPLEYVLYCTDNFSSINKLGSGGFGEVYLAQDKEDLTIQYAVKKVNSDEFNSSRREVEVRVIIIDGVSHSLISIHLILIFINL